MRSSPTNVADDDHLLDDHIDVAGLSTGERELRRFSIFFYREYRVRTLVRRVSRLYLFGKLCEATLGTNPRITWAITEYSWYGPVSCLSRFAEVACRDAVRLYPGMARRE